MTPKSAYQSSVRLLSIGIVLLMLALALAYGGHKAVHAQPAVTPPIAEFPLPPHQVFGGGFMSIAGGPDGAVWFTSIDGCTTSGGATVCSSSNNVGRITTAGVMNELSFSGLVYDPLNVALGPDHNLWVSGGSGTAGSPAGPAFVGKMTPQGVSTPYPVNGACDQPRAITVGPDGALWFTSTSCNDGIIRTISSAGVLGGSFDTGLIGGLEGLTTGPDGALWFTSYNAVGRITTSGAVTSLFTAPSGSCSLLGITTGPDHNLWFTDGCNHSIDRMTTSGAVTRYPVPGANPFPFGITAAPDGNIWFTAGQAGVGFITPGASTVTMFPVPVSGSSTAALTVGPDGNLWFIDLGTNAVGSVTLNPLSVTNVNPSSGDPAGGTNVTITGTGFSTTPGATGFAFGSDPASNVSCSSDKLCTAKTPKGNAGTVDVIATANGYTSPANASDQFTYAPVMFTISDQQVDVAQPITFSGSGWDPNGGPIEIVYDDHVQQKTVQTIPEAATFNGSFTTTFGHPLADLNVGCTGTLKARQNGVEKTRDLTAQRTELVLVADGLVEAAILNPQPVANRVVQAPDLICGSETVGVAEGSTLVFIQLQTSPSPVRGPSPNFASVDIKAQSDHNEVTLHNPLMRIQAQPESGSIWLNLGANFCMGLTGRRFVQISFSPRAQVAPAASIVGACTSGPGSTTDVPNACSGIAGAQTISDLGPSSSLSGTVISPHDLTAQGNVTLEGAVFCVRGNARIIGDLTGTGSLQANGRLEVDGGLELMTDDVITLQSKGDMMIRGSSGAATTASQPVPPGTTELFVASTTNFAVGDTVRIDPGMPIQEDRVVTGISSLLLNHPLTFAHAAGAQVIDMGTPPPDTTAPTTSATAPQANANGWYRTPISASLAADDGTGSGVAVTDYGLDNASCSPATPTSCTAYAGTPIAIAANGRHTLTYFSIDRAGNVETAHILALNLDTVPPVTSLSQTGSVCGTAVSLSAADATSGVDFIETNLNNAGWQRYTGPVTVRSGLTLQYRAHDVAGNIEATHTFTATGIARGRCPSPFS